MGEWGGVGGVGGNGHVNDEFRNGGTTLNGDSRADAGPRPVIANTTIASFIYVGGYVSVVPCYCDDHVIDRCISPR